MSHSEGAYCYEVCSIQFKLKGDLVGGRKWVVFSVIKIMYLFLLSFLVRSRLSFQPFKFPLVHYPVISRITTPFYKMPYGTLVNVPLLSLSKLVNKCQPGTIPLKFSPEANFHSSIKFQPVYLVISLPLIYYSCYREPIQIHLDHENVIRDLIKCFAEM